MPKPITWEIRIRPVADITADPFGCAVANFTCTARTAACEVSGIVTRGPQGLAVDRMEVESGDWAGLNTRLLASLPLARILAEVRPHFAARPAEDVCAAEVAAAPAARRNAVSDPLLMVVAMSYLRETAAGQPAGALVRLAAEFGRPEKTVQRWIARARQDGWLGPGSRGRVGSEPGPRLLALRSAV